MTARATEPTLVPPEAPTPRCACGHTLAEHEANGPQTAAWCWGAGHTDDEIGWPLCGCAWPEGGTL